jgi:hypothetical protein
MAKKRGSIEGQANPKQMQWQAAGVVTAKVAQELTSSFHDSK